MAGEGVITWLCGLLMQGIHIKMYFYWSGAVLIGMGVVIASIIGSLDDYRTLKNERLCK